MKVVEVVFSKTNVEQREVLNALLEDVGYEGFWLDGDQFKAYISLSSFNKNLITSIIDNFDENIQFTVNELPDVNWNELWESNFEPVEIEKELIIRAPFHKQNNDFNQEVIIEPQMSFGTGHHQTTYLMARYLLSMNLKGRSVLDMGCGTGVLAILAALNGAQSVCAIDIEKNAVENSELNMKHNSIKDIQLIEGDVNVIPNVKYDVIIANINKNILIKDIPNYALHLKNEGVLLLSGFFITDEQEILDETSKNSLYLLDSINKENWSMLVVEKK